MIKLRIRRWAQLRFLIINGHVGEGFRSGVLKRALSIWKNVDVIFIQEGRHANEWFAHLGGKFHITPEPRKADQPMTYVCLRKSRFTILGETTKNITHGGQYPRELDGVVAHDNISNQTMGFSSFHNDPLGKGFHAASESARNKQIQQTAEYVTWHKNMSSTILPFSGGDTNNWLPNTTQVGSVRHQFAKINMTPLFTHLKHPGEVNLLDLFARFGAMVKPVRRVYRWIHVPGMDHGVVYAVVKVRILTN